MTTAGNKPAQRTRPHRSLRPVRSPEQRAARQRETEALLSSIGRLWLAFARGQLVLMVVVGVITWLGLLALGVPWAMWLGAAAGVLEIVPNLGPVLSTIAGAAVALWKGSSYLPLEPPLLAGLVVLFYVLVQVVENYLIVPRVMGDALKLPALVVLAGVIIGGLVASVPGAVLATPLIATARELWRYRTTLNRKDAKNAKNSKG